MMSKHNNGERKLFAHLHPKSAIAESFRTLRTNLSFSPTDRPYKVILITSSGPGDGKSTITSNLGVVMAQAGSRVLIVDCDFRKPVVHKIFEMDNFRGLTNLLVQDLEIEDVIRKSGIDGLWTLTSGPIPPNPSELLGSQKMKTFVKKVAGQYDTILLDAPPIIAVTDAAVLAPLVDGVVLVVKAGDTRIEMIKEAKAQLMKANAKIIGVVLNDVKMHGDGYYKNYYYYYGGKDGSSKEAAI